MAYEPFRPPNALILPASSDGDSRRAGSGQRPPPVRSNVVKPPGLRPADIGFLFRVRGPSGLLGDFQSVEGISHTIDVLEYVEGARNGGVRVLAGPVKHGRLTLKSGIMISDTLFNWAQSVKIGAKFRRELLITQLTRTGAALRVFSVEGAFPVEWKAPSLNAMASEVPIEELTLAYQSLTMEVQDDGT